MQICYEDISQETIWKHVWLTCGASSYTSPPNRLWAC